MLTSKPKNINIPIFFVNGITSSPLFVKILDKDKYSRLLPKNYKDFIETASVKKTLIWPLGELRFDDISCLFETVAKREKDGEITVKPPDGIKIESGSIQKVSNFSENGEELFNVDLPYCLYGYRNVFNVPYDWIHYFYNSDEIFRQLKEKIEYEVSKTGQKAFLYGYSLGGNFIRYFLNDYSNPKWNSKYIAGAQFGASVIGGAFSAIMGLINGIFPLSKSGNISFIKHMPSYIAMFPNFNFNKKIIRKTVIDSKSNIKTTFYDSSQMFELLKKSGKIDQTADLIYQKGLNFFKEDIADPKIKTNFIFNSGLSASVGLDVTIQNSECEVMKVFGNGDGVVPSNGIEYVISKWSNVTYHDFKSRNTEFNHLRLVNKPIYAKLTRQFIDSL